MGHTYVGGTRPISNWGDKKHYYRKSYNPTRGVSLCDTIENFPSKLKQAMFAAASRGVIKRGTWNGCAFNAAGMEVGHGKAVNSFEKAARTFGVTTASVEQFIGIWDSMKGTDEDCTQTLRTCIEKAGLFIEPGQKAPRIIRVKVYEDQQKKMREQFDTLMEANMIEGADLMEDLLVGAI